MTTTPTTVSRLSPGHATEHKPTTYAEQLRIELGRDRLLRFAVITVEFAMVVLAIRLLNIESTAFEQVLTLALGGFVVNHFLPAAWRMNFFAALSVTSVLLIFGLTSGAWILGMGTFLIALCHLPISMRARVATVVAVGIALSLARVQVLPVVSSAIPVAIWPILGSMFMFRLMIYIYDLSNRAAPVGIGRSFSYFFMLPNVCFPLFPIVDYKTFQRSAYNDDALHIYHTGARWMLRGLVHLCLYKIVYFLGVIDPTQATDGISAGRYMVMAYLLYFKISGLYHMIVGLLHMFGFGMPETHHLYLLSSSFTDLWRRINIYWKDFIQKLVFNPTYFALRKQNEVVAIGVSTAVAAFLTWFLHGYQWFWIRGEFPIVLVDVLFWTSLGTFLTINVVLEAKRGRKRTLEKKTKTFADDVAICLKTAGMFMTIVAMWTFWNTPKLDELTHVGRALLNSGPLDIAVILGIPLLLGVIRAVVGDSPRQTFGVSGATAKAAKAFWGQSVVVCVTAAALALFAMRPALLVPISPVLAGLIHDVREGRLNQADTRNLQRGYYEDLGDVTRFNSDLWNLYGGRPKGWGDSPQTRERTDPIQMEFVPSTTDVFKGALRTINSLGLRDREYTLAKPAGTFRIAIVGASHDMGAGVRDHETYENLVEDRLNRELSPKTGLKYEIINFSHGGYMPTNKLAVIEKKIVQYSPDAILFGLYSEDFDWVFDSLPHLIRNHHVDDFPFIREAMNRGGLKVQGEVPPEKIEINTRLAPYAEDALRSLLARYRDGTRAKGIRPAIILLELPENSAIRSPAFDRMAGLAKSLDLPLLDIQGAYEKVSDRKTLWIAPWDSHANAMGHKLLADRVYDVMLRERFVPTEAPQAAGK